MSHLRSLDDLRARLSSELSPSQVFRSQVWGNPRAMTLALRKLKRDLGDGATVAPGPDVLQASLARFATTQEVENFTELKYVCYGVSVPLARDELRIIDQAPLFKRLLALVAERRAQPKQFRRCYQGLLTGYFGFDRQPMASGAGPGNWDTLRTFLDDELQTLIDSASARGTLPEWLPLLGAHRNLLTDEPCRRYAEGLAAGAANELKQICAGLGIASNSWVWDEALLAYVQAVCERKDDSFHGGLPGILDLINGRTELHLSQNLGRRSTALAVARYSQCADRPEHGELRDSSLHWIGNPRLNRAAWDAVVRHEPAREMVEGWLKRRLIKDFFELLAEDGAADLRRLNYWLEWEPQIGNMWFVLGGDARRNKSEAFLSLRKRMVGFDRILAGNNDQNNAFVMRIGPLLVIEFGVVGNACYVFAASDFQTNLDARSFTIHDLKQRASALRLSHMHQWERRFDFEIKDRLRSVLAEKGVPARDAVPSVASEPLRALSLPISTTGDSKNSDDVQAQHDNSNASRPVRHSLTDANFEMIQTFCVQRGILWEDNRPKQGALWVLVTDRETNIGFSALLERYGFRFSAGRGFWLK